MSKFDFEISLVVWILSLIASYFFHDCLLLVIGTTFNLYHQRSILYNAGEQFVVRVEKVIADDVTALEARIEACEKKSADMTDAYAKMAATAMGDARRRF